MGDEVGGDGGEVERREVATAPAPAAGEAPPTRIYAVGGLVVRGGRVLLTRRPASKRYYPLVWEHPGGVVEEGESWVDALRREMREEVGIEVDLLLDAAIFYQKVVRDDGTEVWWTLHGVQTFTGDPQGMEGQELGWFTPEQIRGLPLTPGSAAALSAAEDVLCLCEPVTVAEAADPRLHDLARLLADHSADDMPPWIDMPRVYASPYDQEAVAELRRRDAAAVDSVVGRRRGLDAEEIRRVEPARARALPVEEIRAASADAATVRGQAARRLAASARDVHVLLALLATLTSADAHADAHADAAPDDDDVVETSPWSKWIESHLDELRDLGAAWVLLDPEVGIVFHTEDEVEFGDHLCQRPPEDRDRLMPFHTSLYVAPPARSNAHLDPEAALVASSADDRKSSAVDAGRWRAVAEAASALVGAVGAVGPVDEVVAARAASLREALAEVGHGLHVTPHAGAPPPSAVDAPVDRRGRRAGAGGSGELFDADPTCDHDVVTQWSGVKCSKCPGWFCW